MEDLCDKIELSLSDTIIRSEGEAWPAKVHYNPDNNQLTVLIESSWNDHLTVKRITFLDETFKTKMGAYVGMNYRTLKELAKKENSELIRKPSTDGYVILCSSKHKYINYVFEIIDSNNSFYYGAGSIEAFNDDQEISSIVIVAN